MTPGRPGRKPGQIVSPEWARPMADDAHWRPQRNRDVVVPEDMLDDRTCLFCSRSLNPDQRICEHCGAYAP